MHTHESGSPPARRPGPVSRASAPADGYREVWRIPGAPGLLVFGLLGRLGISLEPLGLILTLRQATGRYAGAALAGAVYTVAYALSQPAAGRLVDWLGPARALAAGAAAHTAGLAALIAATHAAGRSAGDPAAHPAGHPAAGGPGVVALAAAVAAAAAAGATYPPLIALLRSAWAGLTEPGGDRAALRRPALAADTTLYQGVFVAGPILVAALVALASPAAVLVAAAAAVAAGSAGLARGPALRGLPAAQPAGAGREHRVSPLRTPGFPALLACSAALGFSFGVVTVAVPAFATGHGASSSSAGVLLAVLGVGSVAGGAVYGTVPVRAALPRQFALLLAAEAAGFAVYAAMPRPGALAVALFCGGALVAPALTVESALVGRIIPAAARTRAYTWIVGVEVGATAAGLQAAGLIADGSRGSERAFLAAAAAVALAALAALPASGPLARAAGRPAAAED